MVEVTLEKQGRGFKHYFKIFIKDYVIIFLVCAVVCVFNEVLYGGTEILKYPVWRTLVSIALYAVFWATICYPLFSLTIRKFKSPRALLVLSLALFVAKTSWELEKTIGQSNSQFGPIFNETGDFTLFGFLSSFLTPLMFLACYALILIVIQRRASRNGG